METSSHKTVNRAATTQPAAAKKGVQHKAVSVTRPLQVQTATKVSSPGDPAEKEAEATSKKIMRMTVPEGTIQRREAEGIQRKAMPNVAPNVATEIQNNMAGGSPLSSGLRKAMEPRFRADFSKVKIHTGENAAKLSRQVNAQAFTMGSHIFFGKDKFKPESQEGQELIAHELTHTIQQGAGIQRSEAEQRMFRTRDGKMVELPPDITHEEATKLEAEAKVAEKKLGKGPPPQPVPDAKKLAKKGEKKEKSKPEGKSKKGDKVKGKALPKAGGRAVALLKAIGSSKVAKYLAAKGAPVLSKGVGLLQKLKQNEQTHDSAAQKLQQSEAAVAIPASEGQSKSNTGQVNTVSGRPAPPADENKAKQKLQESLGENIPQRIEDVDNFKRDKKAQHMGADVMTVVQSDKNAVTATFADMEQTPPPAPPEQTPEALPPEEAAPSTSNMNLGQNAIAPLQKEHTDLSNYTKEGDSKLKEEGITQEQLDMVDSGDLAAANKEKKGMETAAKTEPLAVQKLAQQETDKVDKSLKQEETKERDGLKAKRKAGLGVTGQKQKNAKSALEKKREEVANKINGIFKTAQEKVKKKLTDLEVQSMKRFDDGNARATKGFEDNVNREIDAFKDERYSGVFGWAKKAKDWLLGMDDLPEVKAIFDRNRATFVGTINTLVENISADNKRVIQECKDELANAKKEIKEYVDKLGPDLKDIGKKSAEEMNAKLAEMDEFVAKKEQELQDKLKDKQQAAIKAIDEKIAKMKESMSGALAKLGNLLLLAAKKFFTWALQKVGYSLGEIEGIINKGVAVLKAIFTKPIVFVKNLMNAAIMGFKNFGKNFLKHLKDALFEWLTGSLEGLVLPKTWDLKGVAGLALQMIGISYQNVRKHMVTVMTEPVVAGLEESFTLVKTLITEGPMAAWEQLKEMAGEMRDAFVDAVKDFIKMKIIEQAILWLVSIFIPGAGIVKAIIGIYDTVVFFIQKAKQIMQMISNFLGSIGAIAAGNIGAAADAMEAGLARGLSLVISFLAKLLRLSGITKKIQDAIQKIKGKVDNVLLKVAKWIADKAKALFGAVKSGVKSVVEWWKAKKPFKTKGGESHTIFYSGKEKEAIPMVASKDPKPITKKLAELSMLAKASDATVEQKNSLAKIHQTENMLKTPDDPNIVNNVRDLFEIFYGDSPTKKTVYLKQGQTLKGDSTVVGAYMRIDWLSHHYIEGNPGSPPGSGQDKLMSKLVVDPNKRSAFKYVRGHLLNENLGGKGENENLFPITANANSRHLSSTEKYVKNWVAPDARDTKGEKIKKKKHYAMYEVEAAVGKSELNHPNIANNFVDSKLNCKVVLKDELGKTEDIFQTSITSEYGRKHEKAETTKVL